MQEIKRQNETGVKRNRHVSIFSSLFWELSPGNDLLLKFSCLVLPSGSSSVSDLVDLQSVVGCSVGPWCLPPSWAGLRLMWHTLIVLNIKTLASLRVSVPRLATCSWISRETSWIPQQAVNSTGSAPLEIDPQLHHHHHVRRRGATVSAPVPVTPGRGRQGSAGV